MTQFLAIRKTASTLYVRVHQPNDLEMSHNLHLHNSYLYPLDNNNVQLIQIWQKQAILQNLLTILNVALKECSYTCMP